MIRSLAAALLLAALATAAVAQPGGEVLVVDRKRAIAESRTGQALRQAERRRRAELKAWIDGLRAELESEEAELARLRDELEEGTFDERVRAFDDKVRKARRRIRVEDEALQSEFAEANERLRAALGPVLVEVLRRNDAALIVDAASVLAVRDGRNVTGQVIDLLDTRTVDFGLDEPGDGPPE